jgi:hypothetical protein
LQLSSVLLIRRYPRQDMRRTQFQFEDALGPVLSATAVVANLPPGGSPNQPRFTITKNNISLAVTDITVQLALQFADPPFSIPAPPLNDLAEWATVLDSALDKILPSQKAWYSGSIAVLDVPDGREGFDVPAISNDLVKINMKSPPTTANMTLAWQDGMLNKSFEFSEYSTFFKEGPPAPGTRSISIDTDFDPVNQKGTQIKLDVNNKPQRLNPPPSSNLVQLFDSLGKVARTDVVTWFGEERAKKIRQALGVLS